MFKQSAAHINGKSIVYCDLVLLVDTVFAYAIPFLVSGLCCHYDIGGHDTESPSPPEALPVPSCPSATNTELKYLMMNGSNLLKISLRPVKSPLYSRKRERERQRNRREKEKAFRRTRGEKAWRSEGMADLWNAGSITKPSSNLKRDWVQQTPLELSSYD